MLILSTEELERRAKAAGISIAEICRRAKVAASTPSRWKARTHQPRMATLQRITGVVEAAEETAPGQDA